LSLQCKDELPPIEATDGVEPGRVPDHSGGQALALGLLLEADHGLESGRVLDHCGGQALADGVERGGVPDHGGGQALADGVEPGRVPDHGGGQALALGLRSPPYVVARIFACLIRGHDSLGVLGDQPT